MIAHWMLYCVAVGTLLSAGAVALELALRPLGRGTRWVWAGAMLLSLAIPAGARAFGSLRPAPAAVPVQTLTAGVGGEAGAAPARRARGWLAEALAPERLQTPLAVLWIASSALAALALAGMAGALGRRRRAWAPAQVDGVPVLVSPDVGPAVVGLFRSRIVLPRWALDADAEARALVLRHEQEHVRAGDPRLLAAALAATVLTPWNPAVWWQLRRLRLAVEVDCDARVLARRGDVRTYGSVLLEMGRRTTHARPAASAAFAEPVSTLERRIRIMTAPRVRRPLLRAAGLGAVAVALAIAACETPTPMQPSPGGTRQVAGPEGSFARSPLTPRALLEQYYAEVLRNGTPPGDIIAFVLDADGQVVSHDYLRAAPVAATAGQTQTARLEAYNRYADQTASVNVIKAKPGELGPTEVQMMLVQLKPTVATGSTAAQSAEEEAHRAAFRAAVRRHYPPAFRDAGITGRIALSMQVGDDGRARDVEVVRGDPRFADAARAVVNDLTFTNSGQTVMVIDFAPERVQVSEIR
ncbi:MAG TPA: M56 family metallopeptidase [Longimicrobium sp.]|jgi:beta-lactamase regulating signal transducer with metallopeptidase domain